MFGIRLISGMLLAALLLTSNAHLPLLQVVAWSDMVVSYSRDNSLADAVEMTFDGEHPCPMCKVIEKAQTASATQSPPDGLERSFHRETSGLPAESSPLLSLYHRNVIWGLFDLRGLSPDRSPPPNPPPILA